MINFFVPTYYYLVICTSAIEIKRTERNVFVENKPHNMCDEALLLDKTLENTTAILRKIRQKNDSIFFLEQAGKNFT